MRNRALSVTRGSIPYIKELRALAKSVVGCIVMQQLDYWFDKYPDGFFKFLEACASPRYKAGQGWCEEIGCSAEEFITAFEKIGVRYKSKTAFEAAGDKFGRLFYCSYFDRGTGLTHYLRNHELLDAELDRLTLRETDNHGLRETGKSGLRKPATPVSVNRQSRIPETGNPGLHNKDSEITAEITAENTHTSPARATAAEEVCVSELCEQDYYDFARTQKSLHSPNSWAGKHWDKRDRDYLVREWKQEQAEQAGKAEQAPEPLDFTQCVTHVEEVQLINREIDIFGLINSLNAENSVKERVRAHFEEVREREASFAPG